jgi:hypothetical protein
MLSILPVNIGKVSVLGDHDVVEIGKEPGLSENVEEDALDLCSWWTLRKHGINGFISVSSVWNFRA